MQYKIKSIMGNFGFLGLLGFLYFKQNNPLYLMFFSFFGFFSFFWLGKYSNIKRDEVFICNQNKAYNIGIRAGFIAIYYGMIFLNIFLMNLILVVSMQLS